MNNNKLRKAGLQIAATLGFFTRLPLWRWVEIPKKYYENVVPYWPMVGWLTGSLMALTLILTHGLPIMICVVLALVARTLLTGAIHEDGFADFCDGFGGGYSKERILAIMKDSHIGTYGVLGLILYYFLLVNALAGVVSICFDGWVLCLLLVSADSWSKFVASSIVYFLPYARKEEEAKNKLVYKQIEPKELLIGFGFAAFPVLVLWLLKEESVLCLNLLIAGLAATVVAGFLFRYMKRKIEGYTGDCCGATFIIVEAVFYIVLLWLSK